MPSVFTQSKDLTDPNAWVEVAYTGEFFHPKTKRSHQITEEKLNQWKSWHKRLSDSGNHIPLVPSHSKDPLDTVGSVQDVRITEVEKRGKKELSFQIKPKWHDSVISDPQKKDALAIATVSPWWQGVENSEGEQFSVLRHVAITNYPVISDLEKFEDDIYFSLDLMEEQGIIDTTPGRPTETETEKVHDMKPQEIASALGIKIDPNATDEQLTEALKKFGEVSSRNAKALKESVGESAKFSTVVVADRKAVVDSLKESGQLSEDAAELLEPYMDEALFSLDAPNSEKFQKALKSAVKLSSSSAIVEDDDEEDGEFSFDDDEGEFAVVGDGNKGGKGKSKEVSLSEFIRKQYHN